MTTVYKWGIIVSGGHISYKEEVVKIFTSVKMCFVVCVLSVWQAYNKCKPKLFTLCIVIRIHFMIYLLLWWHLQISNRRFSVYGINIFLLVGTILVWSKVNRVKVIRKVRFHQKWTISNRFRKIREKLASYRIYSLRNNSLTKK